MWPDCSPPRTAPVALERLEHVAVADVGGQHADPVLAHQRVEAEVGHHRHGDAVDLEVEREDRDDLVAVDRLAALVDREHPVAVAVEGDPEVEAASRTVCCSSARSVAPQPTLMFSPSGRRRSRAPPLRTAECLGREPGVGAVRAVDDDAQAAQVRAEALEDVLAGTSRSRPRRARSVPGRRRAQRRAAPRSAPPPRRRACGRARRRT